MSKNRVKNRQKSRKNVKIVDKLVKTIENVGIKAKNVKKKRKKSHK